MAKRAKPTAKRKARTATRAARGKTAATKKITKPRRPVKARPAVRKPAPAVKKKTRTATPKAAATRAAKSTIKKTEPLILVLNPGSTSTKVALYRGDEQLAAESIKHQQAEIEQYPRIVDQYPMRQKVVLGFLARQRVDVTSLSAVVDRGGLLKPISSGTYRVNDAMLADLRAAARGEHISNVGAFIAREIADKAGCEAYIVDAVSVDEFSPLARVAGLAEFERKSLLHALNMRMAALQACARLKRTLSQVNLIVAHLGGGISISPVDHGRFTDVNNANEGGPFSPERAGGVPCGALAKLCFSGTSTKDEIVRKLTRGGGLAAYLGTNDAKQACDRAAAGDAGARETVEAMCYQIAKEIGACATALKGKVDAVVLTGGAAFNPMITGLVKQRTAFITENFLVFPGEDEMPALAAGALRVLRGEEKARDY
ncbi:MAG: butyrate kinase [Candidatus Edwardsbacteria bacterium]|nr:butyrate kinase [Candidatus Edwardsbacteria bacterium]